MSAYESGVEIVWKPVPGYEGHYEVSDDGRVRSIGRTIPYTGGTPRRIRSRELKQSLGAHGYYVVNLSLHGTQHVYPVHRLMGLAFMNVASDLMVRHLNDVRTDNRLDNLAVGDAFDNAQDALRNGHNANLNRKQCRAGHPLTEENTYRFPDGRRQCRTCRRRYVAEHRNRTQGAPSV